MNIDLLDINITDRWIRKIIAKHRNNLIWEPGYEAGNEWKYIDIENDQLGLIDILNNYAIEYGFITVFLNKKLYILDRSMIHDSKGLSLKIRSDSSVSLIVHPSIHWMIECIDMNIIRCGKMRR